MAEEQDEDQPIRRRLKLGIVGIGVGASEILPQMEAMPDIQLVAAADINRRVLNTFQHRYGAKAYDSIEKLCADPNVEAVWISTPNRFHAPHTIIAVEHGKHVVVEKPMALSLAEAEKMIEAAEKNKVNSYAVTRKAMARTFGPCEKSFGPVSWAGFARFMCGPIRTGCCDRGPQKS
jgi:predicted homoserine dehydrogenase-like protein